MLIDKLLDNIFVCFLFNSRCPKKIRRSMGLSPSQGHNNLRLYHTTPYHHSHRLDDTIHNLHILHKLQHYPSTVNCLRSPGPTRSESDIFRSNDRYMRNSFPLLSNLPFIGRDASIILVNYSPFALRDPRFGIFHHCSPSVSYF